MINTQSSYYAGINPDSNTSMKELHRLLILIIQENPVPSLPIYTEPSSRILVLIKGRSILLLVSENTPQMHDNSALELATKPMREVFDQDNRSYWKLPFQSLIDNIIKVHFPPIYLQNQLRT